MLRIEITRIHKDNSKSWIRKTFKKEYKGLVILLIKSNSKIYDSDNIIFRKYYR